MAAGVDTDRPRDGRRALGTQHLSVTVTVDDGSGAALANVDVIGTIRVDTVATLDISGTTGSDGTLTVKWTNAPDGCYKTDITMPSQASETFDKPSKKPC